MRLEGKRLFTPREIAQYKYEQDSVASATRRDCSRGALAHGKGWVIICQRRVSDRMRIQDAPTELDRFFV